MAHSPLASPSATNAALARHGIALRKSLGQHFLVDDNVVGRIMALADLPTEAIVLEVGPGIGTLTHALCRAAAAVVAVECDRSLLPALGEVAGEYGNLTLVRDDAVRVPISDLTTPLGPPGWLVANLPYSVAATVVLRVFEEMPTVHTAVVMVQSEVADRMAAAPGSKAYGAYTVKLLLRAKPVGRFVVPRTVFMPPPRVDSSVLRIERVARAHEPRVLAIADELAVAAFAQRRKTLRNSVLATGGWDGPCLDRVLDDAGIVGRRRAESLSVDEYVALAVELGGCSPRP